ncbi:MAG: DEAD/DEAH box helicase [Proteobacteria bacterium]|nr:DEAD/DEAH box helicase [Pseudomonadota bacterium]
MSADTSHSTPRFTDFGLPEPLLHALADVGYESPSPIQSATLPHLLAGRDLIGQAQTGTGKTAAFALPILARVVAARAAAGEGAPSRSQTAARGPRALVLAPTRELAIQVAEAFQRYAAHATGFHVLPIYGGQGYGPQLSALRRGVDVVVGTPGRVIDHLERGTLDLSSLECLVLDEADEMLRMGFIDDVETVLKKIPEQRQVVLFSATMPAQIKRIAQTYLRDPVEIAIAAKTTTAAGIRQRYWMVSGVNKLDALTRILEAEPFDAMLVFARTKQATEELAGKLAARGLSAAAINGDIPQPQRERAIARLKDGQLDILVATDVAARGLDVDRISHVLNYDIPYDTESYVHRIGRTGRAGRKGEAIVFVAPRERGMLRAIERATRQPIEPMSLPSVEAVNDQRVAKFLARITDALAGADLAVFRDLVARYENEHNVPAIEIAAALAKLVQGKQPLLLDVPAHPSPSTHRDEKFAKPSPPPLTGEGLGRGGERRPPSSKSASTASPRSAHGTDPTDTPSPSPLAGEGLGRGGERRHTAPPRNTAELHFADDSPPRMSKRRPRDEPEAGMETFRIEVGHVHGVQPGNIVGAIANEADLESRYIGRIDIRDAYSLVDLPVGMPRQLLEHLKRVRVAGQMLRIRRESAPAVEHERGFVNGPRPRSARVNPGKPKPHRKGAPRKSG